MDLPAYLLYGLAIPALVASLLLWLAFRCRPRSLDLSSATRVTCPGMLAALAIAIASSLAWYLQIEEALPLFPPDSPQDWYFYLPLLGLTVAALPSLLPAERFRSATLTLPASCLLAWLLLSPLQQDWWTILGVGLLVTAFWTALENSVSQLGSQTVLLQLCLLGSAGACISHLGGSDRVALRGGSLTCILGSTAAVLFLFHRSEDNDLRVAPGITAVAAVLFASLWINGPFYDDVPRFSAVLLVVAPCASVVFSRLYRSRPGRLSSVVRAWLPTAICVIAAVGFAIFHAEGSGDAGS